MADLLADMDKVKVGFVVPMQSLRSTIKKTFKGVDKLTQKMVISPVQVPKDTYDILIVDEAHRLRQRKALAQYPSFDKNNRLFGLGNEGTELDWIKRSSRYQIFFYDSMQSVKPSDIDREVFEELEEDKRTVTLTLDSQLRCAGGNDYIRYVKDIMTGSGPEKKTFGSYDLRLYDDVDKMVSDIKRRDAEYGLCRTVAGYSWKWLSKNDPETYDIEIGENRFRWNSVNTDWVNSSDALDEIGCIHTIQGYDLNYTGVIFGKEIYYDEPSGMIMVRKKEYYDLQGKTALRNDGALHDYIVNIYTTLMTRGIRGTYVYACDEALRRYLGRYIDR